MTGPESPTARQDLELIAADVGTLLNQQVTHWHQRPGVWDDTGLGCLECAARRRLRAWVDGFDDAC